MKGGKKVSNNFDYEPMLEVYIFETSMILEQLEQVILTSEKNGKFSEDIINEVFRFMHTIKGSSAMMLFNNIASLSHQMEDLFYFIRENKVENIDFSKLSDLVLSGVDFIKVEVNKIKNNDQPDGDPEVLIKGFKSHLSDLKKQNNIKTTPAKTVVEKRQQYYIAPDKRTNDDAIKYFRALINFEVGCEIGRAHV